MKIKCYFVLILSILCLFGYSQNNINYSIRLEYDIPAKNYISNFFIETSDSYYFIRFDNKGFVITKDSKIFIEKFNKNFEHISSSELEFPKNVLSNKITPLKFLNIKGHLILYATSYFASNNMFISYLIKYNYNGKIEENPLKLGEQKVFDLKKLIAYKYFKIIKYNDKILFIQKIDESNKVKLILKSINIDLFYDWEKSFVINYSPIFYQVIDVNINKNQEIFFLVKTIDINKNMKDIYKLNIYNPVKNETVTYDITIKDKEISKIKLGRHSDGKIYIYGFYKNKDENNILGTFYFLFDSKIIISQAISKISEKIKDELKKSKSRGKEKIKNARLQELIFTDDKKIIIITEFDWTEMSNFYDSDGKFYQRPLYFSFDIFIQCFDISGSLLWSKLIPKNQITSYAFDILSYKSILTKDKLYFLFNDNVKNKNVYDIKKIKKMNTNFILNVCELNLLTGDYKKNILTIKKNEVCFRKKYTFKTFNGNLLIIDKNKKIRLLEIKFE